MGKHVTVVDYGLGNLRSVSKAVEAVGAKAVVTNDSKKIRRAESIILPGVGAFQRAMVNLTKLEILPTLINFIKLGKPFLGICLGLQILFTESEEHGRHRGLDVIAGKVKRFPSGLKIPHMGWNRVRFKSQRSKFKIFKDIPNNSYFYFVHSYYVQPENKKVIVATTDYGETFTSVINKDNLWGVQFHPEKSGNLGLKILQNFIKI